MSAELEREVVKLDDTYSRQGRGRRRRNYYLRREDIDVDTVAITIVLADREGLPTNTVLSKSVVCERDVALAVVTDVFEYGNHCYSQPGTEQEESPADDELVTDERVCEILTRLIAAAITT